MPHLMEGAFDVRHRVSSSNLKYVSCRVATTIDQSEVKQSKGGAVDLYIVAHVPIFQVKTLERDASQTPEQDTLETLERDASEALRKAREIRNSLASINRISPEILSCILDYHCEEEREEVDRDLIALTHVCHGWREMFISRSSLWTKLDFKSNDKTRAYLQRSQPSPLEFYLNRFRAIDSLLDLMIPNICRLKSLTIDSYTFTRILEHFYCRVPSLEKLNVNVCGTSVCIGGSLLGGDLSLLRELRLYGVFTDLSWKNLANLQVVDLDSSRYGVTQILDFLESAPLLHTVLLWYPMVEAKSIAPPTERIVPLRHLKIFSIRTHSSPLILLRQLDIPVGASLISKFTYPGTSPFADYLPERSLKWNNLSHITTINLLFERARNLVRLSGPSGSLRVLARYSHSQGYPLDTGERGILHSLGHPMLSTIQGLVVSGYQFPRPAEASECPVLQMLSPMENLGTLTLIDSDSLPFILALHPGQNPSGPVLCPNMEKLTFYARDHRYPLDGKHLIGMAKSRASRGAKLSSVTFVSLGGCGHKKKVFELRKHVSQVEYRSDGIVPAWDNVPGVNVHLDNHEQRFPKFFKPVLRR